MTKEAHVSSNYTSVPLRGIYEKTKNQKGNRT